MTIEFGTLTYIYEKGQKVQNTASSYFEIWKKIYKKGNVIYVFGTNRKIINCTYSYWPKECKLHQ